MLIKRPRRIYMKNNKYFMYINGRKKYFKSINQIKNKRIIRKYYKKTKRKIPKNIKKKKKKINKFLSGIIEWKIWAWNFLENQINKNLMKNMNEDIMSNKNEEKILSLENKKNDELVPYEKNEMNKEDIDKFLLNVWNRINEIRDIGMAKIEEMEKKRDEINNDLIEKNKIYENELEIMKNKKNKKSDKIKKMKSDIQKQQINLELLNEDMKQKINEINNVNDQLNLQKNKIKLKKEKIINLENTIKDKQIYDLISSKTKEGIDELYYQLTNNKINYKNKINKDAMTKFVIENVDKNKLIDALKIKIDDPEEWKLDIWNIGDGVIKKKKKYDDGLWMSEINNIMKIFKYFSGVCTWFNLDEIFDNIINKKLKKFWFIILNLKNKSSKYGHYIAIYCDINNDQWFEIYDPLWKNNIWNSFINKIKSLIEKLKAEWYLKLKIN